MSFAGGILLIATGLAIMALGLFVFYAWLPLLYALVGFDIGLLFGRWLTGGIDAISIILGIIAAAILGIASYSLEPYRRILIGVSGGVLIGLALATAFGLDGRLGAIIGAVLAVVFGLIGASVVPRYFDLFIIVATAITGASMIMAGAHVLLPTFSAFDVVNGGIMPSILFFILVAVGIFWQLSNIGKWINAQSSLAGTSKTSTKM